MAYGSTSHIPMMFGGYPQQSLLGLMQPCSTSQLARGTANHGAMLECTAPEMIGLLRRLLSTSLGFLDILGDKAVCTLPICCLNALYGWHPCMLLMHCFVLGMATESAMRACRAAHWKCISLHARQA